MKPATTGPLFGDDAQLMAQIAQGSAIAFGELYDRYEQRAFRTARSVCRRDDCAEDAVQDAFISIWRSGTTYRSERGTVAAWLMTTVRYRALDAALRDRKHSARRVPEDALQHVPSSEDVAVEVVARDRANRVHAALARLPDAQREVITLAFFGELTHTEVAAQLGLPVGTVKGRMRLGLNKLRGELSR